MENFIHALLSFDNEIQKDLIKKLKNNEKLNEYEFHYLRILDKVRRKQNV